MPISGRSPSIRFGSFQLTPASGELYQDGRKIPLQPKALEVLKALLERPGEVLTREELHHRLWSGDTFVEFDDSLNHAVKKLRQVLGDSPANPRFLETLPRYGYRFIAPLQNDGDDDNIRSLAVLPLQNLCDDPSQEYFVDGMTDTLITELAGIRALKVISRTSAMQYKGVRKALPQIARELSVDGVIEGTVQRCGEQIRISVQLIHAASDTHLWAHSYEHNFGNILALQGEVARAVVREIRVALTPEEENHLGRIYTTNPQAFEAYLKGQFHWYRLSARHIDQALGYFQIALEKDPDYALAHVGIANVWVVRADSGFVPASETFSKARAAATRALQLDDKLSEAHIALANIAVAHDWDWREGEREFQRGIQLNPNKADGHFMYADFLISRKRFDEWEPEIGRVRELDPLNPFFQCFYGWHLVYLRRYDEAIAELQRALVIEPGFSSAHLGLWGAFYKKGECAKACEEARKFFTALGDREVGDTLSCRPGQDSYAESMLAGAEVLAERSRTAYVPAIRVARLYAHAGAGHQAVRWLQRAWEQREPALLHLAVGWDWDNLRSDPRFQELLACLKLPEE